ncbi:MAG: efflux RND transporter permease subunit [Balneolaceae bacterium]
MKRFGELLLAAPGTVFALLVVLLFLALFPASQIRTDFNLEGFYPEEDPVIENYQLLEETFGRDDNTFLVGLQFAQPIGVDELQIVRSLTDSFSSIEHIREVQSLWNAREIRSEKDQLTFDRYFTDDAIGTEEYVHATLDRISSDSLLAGFMLGQDQSVTALILTVDEPYNTYPNRNRIIDSINEQVSLLPASVSVHKSGIPYFRNQYVNLLNGEIVMYIAISSLLIIGLLWLLYKSIWGVLFPMMIVWATLLFTVALIQLTGGYLEIMSSTIAPILLCVGVADAVHMISKYDDAREQGMDKRKSILEMLMTLGSATFLTSVTTAIGFASLVSSTVMPMQKFGLYTAAGVLIAYLVTIVFLPAALSKSRKKRVFNEKDGRFYPLLQSLLTSVTAFNRKYHTQILMGGVLFVAIFAYGIKDVEVNGRVFDDLSDDTELMQDSRFFSEQLSPQFPMEFIFNTREPDGALQAGLLNDLVAFEAHLLSYPEIHRVVGLHTLLKHVHSLFRDDHSTLPDNDATIAQYVLLMEMNSDEELMRFTDFEYQQLRVTAFTEDAGSKRINQIRDSVGAYMGEHFTDQEITITGTTILSADLTDKIVFSLAWSILIAIVAISLIMTVLFQNVRMIFISMIPNLIPLIVVAGIVGYAGVDIKPSTAVIFTIALGIAVDDSIHFLARFRIEYLRSGAMFPALSATTIRTGRAIIITSLILIAGFGTLITSAFTSTAMMGALVCATIFAALISDLFLLPSLFYKLRPKLMVDETL